METLLTNYDETFRGHMFAYTAYTSWRTKGQKIEQGARGEIVKGAGNMDPPNRGSDMHHNANLYMYN